MKSEFKKVELDRIRYSIVWEDYNSMYNALDITNKDRLLIVSSAGCNVLNALLKEPYKIYAVDINPFQNKLLQFKIDIIKNCNYEIFSKLLGLSKYTFEEVKNILELNKFENYEMWINFFKENTSGLLTSGQLEQYILSFKDGLTEIEDQLLIKLLDSNTIEEQVIILNTLTSTTDFSEKFKTYYSDHNLSKGRDPKLFKYADEKGDSAFLNRFIYFASTRLLKNNFYIQFFFYGLDKINSNILPPCYKEENFNKLKKNIDKIEIIENDAVDFLIENMQIIEKCSFSNIFEYTSKEDFDDSIQQIKTKSEEYRKNLDIVYWNLLHNQQLNSQHKDIMNLNNSESLTRNESCYYFKNVNHIKTYYEQ